MKHAYLRKIQLNLLKFQKHLLDGMHGPYFPMYFLTPDPLLVRSKCATRASNIQRSQSPVVIAKNQTSYLSRSLDLAQ
jgi:hypothetical protein